jgi:ABC-type phosphate/phosphonate transport system substrate-binding protein
MLKLLCAFLLLLSSAAVQAEVAFTLGVLPIHSSRVIVERYEPMRSYLEKKLKRPVRVESAPDFQRFHARMLKGDFDLTITPSHMARVAQLDNRFVPLVQFYPGHDALLIYNIAKPIQLPHGLQMLKGGKLAVIDRLAVTVMATVSYLDENGLEADRDYQVETYNTHAGVAHALIGGLVDAAVTTSQGLMQIPADLRRKIVVYRHIVDIPAFVFMAKPGTSKESAAALRDMMLEFGKEEEGLNFYGRTGYLGVRATTDASMKQMDSYLKATRKILRP